MMLEELLETPKNHKKILRANPYKQLAKATQEHAICLNLLNLEFEQEEPGQGIRHLYHLPAKSFGENGVPVCRDIVAYEVTTTLTMEIVYRTLKKLKEALDGNVHPEAMIHSDQGFHHTHPEYQQRMKEIELTQWMSRRGNCIDNTLMESLFGHFKGDVDFKQATSLAELKGLVEHYNGTRKQWN